jgi:hypothetical protein
MSGNTHSGIYKGYSRLNFKFLPFFEILAVPSQRSKKLSRRHVCHSSGHGDQVTDVADFRPLEINRPSVSYTPLLPLYMYVQIEENIL